MFFAPGILLFAVSGIFQTLGWHESGSGRHPALPFIGVLASLHKEGEAVLPGRKLPPLIAQTKSAGAWTRHDHRERFAPFRIYALLLSASAIVPMMRVMVALANRGARRRTSTLLATGCVLPLLLSFV